MSPSVRLPQVSTEEFVEAMCSLLSHVDTEEELDDMVQRMLHIGCVCISSTHVPFHLDLHEHTSIFPLCHLPPPRSGVDAAHGGALVVLVMHNVHCRNVNISSIH